MNGWQRIGIVISALWTLSVAGYAAYERLDMPIPLFWEVTNHPERGEWSEARNKLFVDYDAHSPSSLNVGATLDAYRNAKTEAEKVAISKELTRIEYSTSLKGVFFAVLVLPIILFWLCAYIGVFAYSWIKQGFKGSR